MRKVVIAILHVLVITSCTNESILSEANLRDELGFEEQNLSDELLSNIVEKTSEINFNSIKEAREFLGNIDNFSETDINIFKINRSILLHGKSNNASKTIKTNLVELQMACPPPIFQEFIPCEGNNGGCGSGSIMLSTGNISLNLQLNVGFNYNSSTNGTGASNFNSHMSGFTLGLSYDHISSSQSVSGNTINFNVHGVINYNIFVDGIGTIYRENVELRGSYNPCTGHSSISRVVGPPPILN